jgi:hypothetical protein
MGFPRNFTVEMRAYTWNKEQTLGTGIKKRAAGMSGAQGQLGTAWSAYRLSCGKDSRGIQVEFLAGAEFTLIHNIQTGSVIHPAIG